MKLTNKEFNLITNEEIVTERDETAAETKARLDGAKAVAASKAEAEAKANARAQILGRLGLTADEVAILLG